MTTTITPTDDVLVKKYTSLQGRSRAKGMAFNLSLAEIKKLLKQKKCFFTGKPLCTKTHSIDRVDSSKGYIMGNVVACDKHFNEKKANLTFEEVEMLYKGLIKHTKRKSK